MAITINGSGTITGLTAGGLPDGSVTNADLEYAGTAGQVLTSQGSGSAPQWTTVSASNLTRLTAVATTSGSSVDFTSLPSGIRKLYVVMNGVKSSSTGTFMVQLGDSGGLETSGYISGSRLHYASGASVYHERTDSFVIFNDATEFYINTIVEIVNISGNRWVSTHTTFHSDRSAYPGSTGHGAGRKELSAELTQLRITLSTGTFTSGLVNVLYEV